MGNKKPKKGGERMKSRPYIYARFQTEDSLIQALEKLKDRDIIDIMSPYPIEGINKYLGYKTRIPVIGFIAGLIGGILGFLFQAWTFTEQYPLNFGGKPFISVPSFIPVTFECAALFAGIAIIIAFLIRNKLGWGLDKNIVDKSITDDSIVLVLKTEKEDKKLLESFGATEVLNK